jgi:shikimate kinase
MDALDSRNIVLTGFMGTGKTTVGRLLADQLGYEFVDTDRVIEERHGTIADLFRSVGEDGFRRIERELAAELADRVGLVISTGGRMMLDPQNVASLSRNGRCLLPGSPRPMRSSTASPTIRPESSVPCWRSRTLASGSSNCSPSAVLTIARFAQLTTDAVSADAVASDLVALATSDPHRFAIDNPSGDYEYSVGAAVLPFVRQLARIEGPMVVVTNAEVGGL